MPRWEENPDGQMVIITINVPSKHLKLIKKYLKERLYPSRSELIRVAIRDFLINESKLYKEFIDPLLDTDDVNTIRVPNGDGTYLHLQKVGEA